ncbi:MAG TPA: hypothetical protein VFB73_13285 [Chloroflexota bacterium]|nr:hypothetical protein [Chloroflexota bacterium]
MVGRYLIGVVLLVSLLAGCAPPAPEALTPSPAPTAVVVPAPPSLELAAVQEPTLEEPPALSPLPPLTADAAVEQVVERAPLPAEARLLARTLRPTMTAEYDPSGYWLVSAGPLGQWRVYEHTWQVEPADGVAELWELQSRLDLR